MKKLAFVLGLLLASAASAQWYPIQDAWTRIDGGLAIPAGYFVIRDEGTDRTQRSYLNFIGSAVSCVDNAGTTATDCTVTASGYATIQDEAGALTQRGIVNFTGAGVTCADNAGATRTDCTIPGGAGFADPGGNGVVVRTALNTSINRTLTPLNTSLTISNGDGTAGNPTFSTSVNTTDDGGAVVKQAASPGVTQTGAFHVGGGISNIITWDGSAGSVNYGLILNNTTAATGGATNQVPPAIRFDGERWDGAATKTQSWRIYQTHGGPSNSELNFANSIDGGAFTNRAQFTTTGGLSLLTSGASFQVSSRLNMSWPSDGVMLLRNSAASDWTKIQFGGTTSSFPAVQKESASAISIKLADNSAYAGISANPVVNQATNGALWTEGYVTEALTLNTGSTTTDTTIDIPANSELLGLVYRITTTITTAASFTIGDPTTAARFCGTQSTLTSGTTGVCLQMQQGSVSTDAAGPVQGGSTAKIRVTTNANPGAGVIRLTLFYRTFTPPTS